MLRELPLLALPENNEPIAAANIVNDAKAVPEEAQAEQSPNEPLTPPEKASTEQTPKESLAPSNSTTNIPANESVDTQL